MSAASMTPDVVLLVSSKQPPRTAPVRSSFCSVQYCASRREAARAHTFGYSEVDFGSARPWLLGVRDSTDEIISKANGATAIRGRRKAKSGTSDFAFCSWPLLFL